MQFPAIMGGVVPVYNLKGIKAGEIKFTGELLAEHLPRQDHEVERRGHRRR